MKKRQKITYAALAVMLAVAGLVLFEATDGDADMPHSAKVSLGGAGAYAQQSEEHDFAQSARPPGVSDSDWEKMLHIFKTQPGSAKEFRRVVDYMAYEAEMRRWEVMRAGESSAERAALASKLLDALPARLANKEVSGAEAKALASAFVADVVADPAERDKRVAFEQQKLSQIRNPEEEALVRQEAVLTAQLESRSKEIVAMHLSANKGQVNEEQLEAQLQAMREKVFAN